MKVQIQRNTKIKFEYIKTKRNTPFLKFAKSVALEIDKNIFTINQDKFEYLYSEFKNIVRIEKEE